MANEQIPLHLVRPVSHVDPSLVTAQPSLLSAIKLCISLGGFKCDKEIYSALNVDAGHWSRIHRGEAHFPTDKFLQTMDICGNEVPLLWLLYQRGYDLHSLRKRETEVEAQLRAERDARIEAEKKLQWAMEALKGGK